MLVNLLFSAHLYLPCLIVVVHMVLAATEKQVLTAQPYLCSRRCLQVCLPYTNNSLHPIVWTFQLQEHEQELCHPTARASSPDSPQWDSAAVRSSLMRACSLASTASPMGHSSTPSSLSSPFHSRAGISCSPFGSSTGSPFAAHAPFSAGSGRHGNSSSSGSRESYQCMDTSNDMYLPQRCDSPMPFGSLCGSYSPFAVQYAAPVGMHH